jgi:4a-hydroxytetrahydrobiopterin dehydratase
MPAAPLLTDKEVAERLETHASWARQGNMLVRTLKLKDFRGALDFVRKIADPADEQDHHPDVEIHWNQVTLKLWTHASGGITERDFRLAAAIDEIAAGL